MYTLYIAACNIASNLLPCYINCVSDHDHDWIHVELRDGALRLAAGGQSVSNGFLEMYYNSQWGGICSVGWDSVDTRVACSQLGFPDTNSVTFNVSAKNSKAAASQPVHSSNVQCDGTESSILTCSQDPIGNNTCDLSSIVMVMCDASSSLGEVAKCIVNSGCLQSTYLCTLFKLSCMLGAR